MDTEIILNAIILWAPPVLLVLSVINALTKHYTKFNGTLRIVMAVVERLSVLASRQTGKRFKSLGVSLKPDPILERMADVQKQFEAISDRKAERTVRSRKG